MRRYRSRGPMHEINVVPYVDVMLVLLVIFMVAAPLVTSGLVELPSVSKAPAAPSTPIEITIRADGSISVRARDARGAVSEERPLGRGELARWVKAQQADDPERPVLIAADRSVRYEAVLGVMDELQKNAVRRVGLLVKPAP